MGMVVDSVLSKRGRDGSLAPLRFNVQLCSKTEDIRDNLEKTLGSKYVPFNKMLDAMRGAVAIVGSGPSLAFTHEKLRRFNGHIIAANSAHDFLIGKGILPTFAMFWDAADVVAKMITPHKDVIYLVASRCHPDVFRVLKGYKVIVWHAGGDIELEDMLIDRKIMEPILSGGSAAVTRLMVMVHAMGYREEHIFGGDGSISDVTHAGKRHVVEESQEEFVYAGRTFLSTNWLVRQADDFYVIAPNLTSMGMKIVVHGDGLIPHMAKTMGIETPELDAPHDACYPTGWHELYDVKVPLNT